MGSPYDYCPECGARGARRERRLNGNDECERGHVYPSVKSVKEPRATVVMEGPMEMRMEMTPRLHEHARALLPGSSTTTRVESLRVEVSNGKTVLVVRYDLA
jgi:hypothetical protein